MKKRSTKYLILAGVVIMAVLFWAVGSMAFEGVKNSAYFVIKQVRINGVYHSNKKKVDAVAKAFVGKNILEVDLEEPVWIDDQWVERVNIARQFPDKLVINIFEKKASFVYRKKGRCYYYIAGDSSIRTNCNAVDVDVTSDDAEANLDAFATIFKKNQQLKKNKIKLYRSYFTTVENGVSVKCSYDAETFSTNIYYFTEGIKERYGKINSVDLRVEGKIYVDGVLNEAG